MKKTLALLLALVMIVALGASAFAEDVSKDPKVNLIFTGTAKPCRSSLTRLQNSPAVLSPVTYTPTLHSSLPKMSGMPSTPAAWPAAWSAIRSPPSPT